MSFAYSITATDPNSYARKGRLCTPHGPLDTPLFMPVGTVGSVKTLWHELLRNLTTPRIILANTYHLLLKPGLGVIHRAGGLHAFTSWQGPMLTDSGGFQVFSLAQRRSIDPKGVHFRAHTDGRSITFTPERAINIQRILGADFIMALDECPPGNAPYDYARDSLAITQQWLERALRQMQRTTPLYGYQQTLVPIIQGGQYMDLRMRSLEHAAPRATHAIAIGGLAVGEPQHVMYQILENLAPLLPPRIPRYLMGVGTPWNLLEAIARGVDLFDCVMPTRNGRNGMLFTNEGIIRIKSARFRNDFTPLPGYAGKQGYTRAYLRHLFDAKEALALAIASLINIEFYLALLQTARERIANGTYTPWMNKTLPILQKSI